MSRQRCPKCEHLGARVMNSRSTGVGDRIRRRRECADCGYRYTTYECIEAVSYTHLTLPTIYSV